MAPANCFARSKLGSISSSRCQITTHRGSSRSGMRNCCLTDEFDGINRLADLSADAASSEELVEPDGIEPTTSCLQSRRSPS